MNFLFMILLKIHRYCIMTLTLLLRNTVTWNLFDQSYLDFKKIARVQRTRGKQVFSSGSLKAFRSASHHKDIFSQLSDTLFC